MQDFSDFQCPWIAKQDIWVRAEEFRATFWPKPTLPIDIESIIEKKLKLNIEPERGLLKTHGIDAYLRTDLTGIVVDYDCFMDDRYSNRLRFSYAHEVGHLRLHKKIYAELPISSTEDWKDFFTTVPEKEYKSLEYQANEFAGRLLVPHEILEKELEEHLKQVKTAGLAEFMERDPDAVLTRITPSLCRPFGVSDTVIGIRAKREGLWPP